MSTGPKKAENRGGARYGAGRPRVEISDHEVKKLLKSARKMEKETGKSVYDILLGMIYGDEGEKPSERVAAMRLYIDAVVTRAKQSDVKIDGNVLHGPSIFLPEQRPDPAKLIKLPGGKQ